MSAQAFEQYVQLQASAAQIVRSACESRDALTMRITELEAELQVWKLGHREAVKDREEAQRTVRDLNGEPLVLCVLDGDGAIFNRQYLSRGRDGGREAALDLTKHISDLADKQLGRAVNVMVQIFFNKQGLSRVLQDLGIATEAVFTSFVQGLNAAHPLFIMTDVGSQKEAADAKFREVLRLYCKLPSCKLVLAGCEHDGGYSHLLQSLETEGLADKIRVLKSFDEAAFDIKRLNLKTVEFPGMFETRKLVSYAQHSAAGIRKPKTPPPPPAPTPKKSALLVPSAAKSATIKTTSFVAPPSGSDDKENGFTTVKKLRNVDPSKPLSKQTPPPCNMFYIRGTCKRQDCFYAHDYRLSPKQRATLKADAKKSPCIDALKGKPCSPGCTAGHRCPHARCPYGGSQGSCKFKARGMHMGEPGYQQESDDDDYSSSD